MDVIARIAEEKIREAIDRGDFDNLPGRGKPLCLDEDLHVPQELRLAYKVLKNAGFVPPELEVRKEVMSLRDLVRSAEGAEKERLSRELGFKLMKFNLLTKRPLNLDDFPEYAEKVSERLGRA